MKVGFIINNSRMAPCFSGNDLCVYDDSFKSTEYEIIDTTGWKLRDWATELLKRDIDQLLCSGIDQFLCGALLGNGIIVIFNIVGTIEEVRDKWQKGLISSKQEYGFRGRHCGHGRQRCRKGTMNYER